MRTTPTYRCLATVLALAAAHAHAAEWTLLPGPASSGVSVYTERSTERPRHNAFVGFFLPNPRQAWFLTDYDTPHRWTLYRIGSSKQLVELDCKRHSARVLTRMYYDGRMGQGRLLASEPAAADFSRVAPGDVEEIMLQSSCARAAEPAPGPAETASVPPPMGDSAAAPQ